MWAKAILLAKGVVIGYWLWVAKVLVLGSSSGFEAVVGLSAPLILSLHFVQAITMLRRVRSDEPFWKQLAQTLFFGALYLAPRLLGSSASAPRPPATRPSRPAR